MDYQRKQDNATEENTRDTYISRKSRRDEDELCSRMQRSTISRERSRSPPPVSSYRDRRDRERTERTWASRSPSPSSTRGRRVSRSPSPPRRRRASPNYDPVPADREYNPHTYLKSISEEEARPRRHQERTQERRQENREWTRDERIAWYEQKHGAGPRRR